MSKIPESYKMQNCCYDCKYSKAYTDDYDGEITCYCCSDGTTRPDHFIGLAEPLIVLKWAEEHEVNKSGICDKWEAEA